MSNEAARAALRERAATPLALVETNLVLGGVKVYVRALPFRQSMRLRTEHPDDPADIAEARLILPCLFDAEGALLFDPLDDEDLQAIADQPRADFWTEIMQALGESSGPGKASAQTTSS